MSTGFAYWNNGSPRVIRSRKNFDGNGGYLAGPEPTLDIYNHVKVGPEQPALFRRQTGLTHSKTGGTITTTYTDNWEPIEKIREIKIQISRAYAASILTPDDWQVIRAVDDPTKPLTSSLTNYRAAVRAESNLFEAAIKIELDPATAAGMEPNWPVDTRLPVAPV